ncbi:Nn.00g045170.m01.CDS01 [Neocucurbitaria sp. VM-36]
MSTGVPPSSNLNIETKNIQTAGGITLSEEQQTIVGSVLDLFAGRPSLPKLALWRDDATFTDPITIATGRDRYAAQWYGLQSAFSEIERLSHQVKDAGNPILMDLRTRYVIKGINKEQTIQSVVAIHLDDQGKISKVEDKWDGKLPDGAISNVSFIFQLLSPFWWLNYWIAWAFWLWSFTWDTRGWKAFRHLNAITVPKMISVPKNEEEDAKRGN